MKPNNVGGFILVKEKKNTWVNENFAAGLIHFFR